MRHLIVEPAQIRDTSELEMPESMSRSSTATMGSVAADRLVWLMVEDLHRADASTLGLVTDLALRRGLGQLPAVSTLRTHDPASPDDIAPVVCDLAGGSAAAAQLTRVLHLPRPGGVLERADGDPDEQPSVDDTAEDQDRWRHRCSPDREPRRTDRDSGPRR